MKIVILGTSWPYRGGGIATYNERLARQFMAEGHEVEILTFTLQYPDFLFPGKTQYSDEPAPADLKITRVMNSVNPFSWWKAARLLRRIKPDVMVVKFWIPLMAPCLGTIARLARRQGIRVVSILDNVIPHEPHFWDKWLIRYFVRSIDHFVAMSDSVKRDCERFLPRTTKARVMLCPHPLYDNFGQPVPQAEAQQQLGLNPDYRYLLFFGFIRDYKGLDLLMHAFADPRLRHYRVKLIVAGEFYNNAEQYAQLEKQLGLEGEIVWHTQFIPNDQVRIYFSAADLIVQPYKTATQSGVTQVAYHFSKPMLVTNVGGLAEIVPHGKVGYVTPVDAKAVADALVDFCSDDNKLRFVRNIETEKKKYAWSRMTEACLAQ
ncbi:MAG: glycosyltransferase [Paludibacteraceae bacterium]|nr:glycosyltransferase [Paludibacteraceae bacterium]